MQNKIIYPKIYFCLSLLFLVVYFFFWLMVYKLIKESYLSELLYIAFIPVILCLIIWFITTKTIKLYPIITKIISHILYILTLVYQVFLFVPILFLGILATSDDDKEYNDIKDYSKALNCYYSESIEHFPKTIPKNAKNINFKRTPGGFLGDSTLMLQFDIDKKYIQNEIDKYKNLGREVFINDEINSKTEKYDFDKERAESTLQELIKENEGYKFKILESTSCIRGFAFKNQNIIYVLYCD